MAKRKAKTKKIGKAKSARQLRSAMPPVVTFDPPRMEVDDYVAWGNLIKSWSKNPKTAPWKNPTTPPPDYGDGDLDELINQCRTAKVGLFVPPGVTKVMIIRQDVDTFILRLPPKPRIEESEKKLKQGGSYPIPQFYNEAYAKSLNIPVRDVGLNFPDDDDGKAKLEFHAQRIGDYIIRLTA
jgi:hypothetical protein